MAILSRQGRIPKDVSRPGPLGWPTFSLIDQNGIVRERWGHRCQKELNHAIDLLIDGRKDSEAASNRSCPRLAIAVEAPGEWRCRWAGWTLTATDATMPNGGLQEIQRPDTQLEVG